MMVFDQQRQGITFDFELVSVINAFVIQNY